MTRIVTAVFASRADADRARDMLLRLGLGLDRIGLHDDPDRPTLPASRDAPGGEAGLPALLDALFLPDADVAAHREALRRGRAVVSAEVEDAQVQAVRQALDEAGAEDLDAHEHAWRREGWSPARMAGAVAGSPAAPAATMPGTGGMDAEAVRQMVTSAQPDAAASGEGPVRMSRREPVIGRARSYVIEAPLAEEATLDEGVANDRGPDRGAA